MMALEDTKVTLMGNWLSIKVMGKNNTMVKAKKLYVDADQKKHEQILNYYNDLISKDNSKAFSMLKSILCEKNVTGIMVNGDILKLFLNKEPAFFNKKPEVEVALYSPEIIDNKDELIDVSYKNYDDSRRQFLDKSIGKENATYIINTKSNISSYENYDNDYIFNISDSNISLFYNREKEFLISAIEYVLSNCNGICYVEYNTVTATKNSVIYYVKDVRLEIDDKIIKIDLLDDQEFENLMNIIYSHNKKVHKNYLKIERRNNNE